MPHKSYCGACGRIALVLRRERRQHIQNAIREVVVRPGPDLDLPRAAAQFEREDRVGSCVAAEFFADTSCFKDMSVGELLEF